jgi:iron complex outermembrane receptor protein
MTVILTGIVSTSSYGQGKGTFSGKVFASDTKEPLIGAHIKLKSDISVGSASNLDGAFSIEAPAGRQTFIISFTGMIKDSVTIEITAGETIFRDVYLNPYVSELEGVEIKVGKFDRRIEDITVSMEVIKPDIIENKNTTNITTILDQVPGLTILDSEPQIRGGSGFTFGVGSKVGIFVDDMPLLSPDAGRPYWELIAVENIEQIEVVKGASSVLSGANALSGAIYIRSAIPKLEPLTRFKVFTGMYSTPKFKEMKWWTGIPYMGGFDVLHSKAYKHLDVILSGNVNLDHNYLGAPRPGPKVADSTSDFADSKMSQERIRFNFGLRKRSKKTEGLNFGLNGSFMYNDAPLTLAWLDDSTGFYRGYPGAVLLQTQYIFYLDPFVNFYSKLGFKHSFKARVLRNVTLSENAQDIRSNLYFADYNFKREYDFLKGFAFIGGLSFQMNDVDAALYAGSGSSRNQLMNLSGYAELENNFFDIINFSIGARVEYFVLNDSVKSFKPIFRAGASFKMMQETYVRLSIGQGYRYPTITERFIKTNLGSIAVFDNPGLVPESSWNAEIGIKQGFKFSKYFGYLDIAFFQQEYRNTIEYLFGFWDSTYSFAIAGFRFMNTGKSRIVGIDISLTGIGQINGHTNIKTIIGYNYILPKTLEPDMVFAKDYNPSGNNTDFSYKTTSIDPGKNILKYRFLHNFKADIEFNRKHFSTGFSFKYYSRIENLDKAIADFEEATINSGGSLQPILYMDYFNNHNNGNLIVDFRVSYEFAGKHKLSLISNNLLNRWYSLRPLKAEPMRNIQVQYRVEL